MPKVMSQCHIVCLPSKYGEGVPRVLLEAAAAGRPVVATDMPGCREVVKDGVEGLLVPAANCMLLAKALRDLLERPEQRKSMATAARVRAVAAFSIDSVIEATMATYGEL